MNGAKSSPALLAAVLLVAGGCVACADPQSPGPGVPDPSVSSGQAPVAGRAAGMALPEVSPQQVAPPGSGDALSLLGSVQVKGRAPLTGYTREQFGTAWEDTNDNGCDTRNDILRRDLVRTVVQDCVVQRGVLIDPYSGDTVEFTRGPVTSMDVQIDHVVPLANAWQTGAFGWSPAKRERFANDRRNLLAVRGDLNMSKQDGDAATWLPPRKAFRCRYVSRQIEVKAEYGLWVTPSEAAAMRRILSSC